MGRILTILLCFFLLVVIFAFNGRAEAHSRIQTDFCASIVNIPVEECEALAAIYTQTNGDSWSDNTGWLVEVNPADWFGVTVEDGHVTRLLLSNNNLQGVLPPEIGTLTSLTELTLRDNHLSGALPAEIGSLSQLVILDLSNNQFSGSLPAGLFNLTSLQYLYLDHNQFGGTLPPAVGSLAALNVLWLNDNLLLGFPPASMTSLTGLFDPGTLQPGNLDGLDLNNNRFCVPTDYPASGNVLHQFLNQKDPDFHLHQTCTPLFDVYLPMVRR